MAGIAAGAELTISILRLRARRECRSTRMPLYAWAWLVTAVMIVFAFTTLFIATLLLELDHDLGTRLGERPAPPHAGHHARAVGPPADQIARWRYAITTCAALARAWLTRPTVMLPRAR